MINKPDSQSPLEKTWRYIVHLTTCNVFECFQTLQQLAETEALEIEKKEINEKLYGQVLPEFESSKKALSIVKPNAEAVVELGRRTTNDVGQLRRDIESLLNKMKELKDKISKSRDISVIFAAAAAFVVC